MGSVGREVVVDEEFVEVLHVLANGKDTVLGIDLPQLEFLAPVVHGAGNEEELCVLFDPMEDLHESLQIGAVRRRVAGKRNELDRRRAVALREVLPTIAHAASSTSWARVRDTWIGS